MVNVLTELQVVDIDRFAEGFLTRGQALRESHGCISSKLYKISGQDDRIILFLEWDSRESYERFLRDPAVGEAMYAGGTLDVGKITYMEPLTASGFAKQPDHAAVVV